MDRFFPVKKAVETVTVQALVAAILFFRCADIFSGKRRESAYNLAQKSAAFSSHWHMFVRTMVNNLYRTFGNFFWITCHAMNLGMHKSRSSV